jgi:hypothetical protein
VIVSFNFVNFFSAMSDNNIDPVIIWWWLRWRKKWGNGKRKHWVIRSSVTMQTQVLIVSKELSQDPKLFKSL